MFLMINKMWLRSVVLPARVSS